MFTFTYQVLTEYSFLDNTFWWHGSLKCAFDFSFLQMTMNMKNKHTPCKILGSTYLYVYTTVLKADACHTIQKQGKIKQMQ